MIESIKQVLVSRQPRKVIVVIGIGILVLLGSYLLVKNSSFCGWPIRPESSVTFVTYENIDELPSRWDVAAFLTLEGWNVDVYKSDFSPNAPAPALIATAEFAGENNYFFDDGKVKGFMTIRFNRNQDLSHRDTGMKKRVYIHLEDGSEPKHRQIFESVVYNLDLDPAQFEYEKLGCISK